MDDWYARVRDLIEGVLDPMDGVFDPNPVVRAYAAARVADPHVMARLADDDSPVVRGMLARRHDLDADTVGVLAWDPDPRVRRIIAARTDLDGTVRRKLSMDMNPDVLDALGEHERADAIRRLPIPPDVRHKGGGRLWR